MANKKFWIDNEKLKNKLVGYFSNNKKDISAFGNTVNQTFEAFVFASLLNFYKQSGWEVKINNPSSDNAVRLKFNTRGRPSKYTYAECKKENKVIQIRHGLRVSTKYDNPDFPYSANIVLDVSVINQIDLSAYKTDQPLPNAYLISFGEAKHMSAFAELIASFIGMVHELKPDVLAEIRLNGSSCPEDMQNNRIHPAPFLYVSGYLNPTAQGIVESIKARGYDIDVFDYQSGKIFGTKLPIKPIPYSK